MKWPTCASRAASTSAFWPSRSTALIESVPNEPIVVAPETTVAAPSHARASDSESRNSPRTTSAPSSSSRLTRSGSDVSRTIARTGLFWPRSASQTAPPTFPVAPTTRFTSTSCSGKASMTQLLADEQGRLGLSAERRSVRAGVMVGRRVFRREDPRFLTGGARYVEDLWLPDALQVTFVRSPFAHARILDVDASVASALPKTRVFTAADLGLGTFPPLAVPGLEQRMSRPFMAGEVVRFAGEIVAAVVTESRAAGADAAELVAVEYEQLPAVIDPRKALEDEVILFPEVGTNVCWRREAEPREDSLFEGC